VVVAPDVRTANSVARSQNLVRNVTPTEERLSGTLDGYTAHFHANNYSRIASSPSCQGSSASATPAVVATT
jgi:hypothetical protein